MLSGESEVGVINSLTNAFNTNLSTNQSAPTCTLKLSTDEVSMDFESKVPKNLVEGFFIKLFF